MCVSPLFALLWPSDDKLELADGRREGLGVADFSRPELSEELDGGTVFSRSLVWSILVIALDFALRCVLWLVTGGGKADLGASADGNTGSDAFRG